MAVVRLRVLLALLALCLLLGSPLLSTAFTDAQLATLKTDITVARAVQFAQELADDNYPAIAAFYNATASPTVLVWRPRVAVDELNTAIVWSAFATLSAQLQTTYLAMTQSGYVDATSLKIQNGFGTIFGGGSATVTALVALSQRPATYLEALFSTTVNGAQVSTVFGQRATNADVAAARRLP